MQDARSTDPPPRTHYDEVRGGWAALYLASSIWVGGGGVGRGGKLRPAPMVVISALSGAGGCLRFFPSISKYSELQRTFNSVEGPSAAPRCVAVLLRLSDRPIGVRESEWMTAAKCSSAETAE